MADSGRYMVIALVVMAATNKDVVLVVSLVLSLVSLVLLFGVTWYFQSSLDLLQQQVEYDRELLMKLQEQVNVREMCMWYITCNMSEWYGHLGCEDDKSHGGENIVVSNYCKWTQAVKKGVAAFKPTWIEGLK